MAEPLLIYVAGAYSADTPEGIQENVDRAVVAGKALLKKGHYVIVPHAMTHKWDLDTDLTWDCFMDNCITLLRKSDAILMLEDWQDSTGSRIEEHNARLRRMMMFYSLDEVPTVD